MASTMRDVSHITKLNCSNYSSWKFGVELLLKEFCLLDLIEGTPAGQCPAEVIISDFGQ